MGVNIGSTSVSGLYLGSTEVTSAYIGSTKVYEKVAPTPTSVVIGGKTYPCALMPDGNVWLTVNLDYAWSGLSVPTSGASASSNPQAMYYNYDESTYGWNGYKCGLLYNRYAVDYLEQNKATLCPGWHVPTYTEWDAFLTAAGGATGEDGTKLKALDEACSNSFPMDWNGTDDYGFGVLPAGYFYNSFKDVGRSSGFWSSSRYGYVFNAGAYVSKNDTRETTQFPVRLVMDQSYVGPGA